MLLYKDIQLNRLKAMKDSKSGINNYLVSTINLAENVVEKKRKVGR